MDLKQYRLTDWEWYNRYKEKYGLEAFQKYKEDIFKMLYDLKPGRLYDLTDAEKRGSKIFQITYTVGGKEVSEQNPDLFIKLCCTFILSCVDYEFTDDFNKIRRI